jgi:hypothetical protein
MENKLYIAIIVPQNFFIMIYEQKQKKLLLECVDHLMEWELHMERATTTKLVKGMFGIDIPETKL